MVDFSPEALEYTGEGADAIHAAADDAEADNGFVDDLTEEIGNIFEPKKDNKSKGNVFAGPDGQGVQEEVYG